MLFRAVVAAREREDQRIAALKLAQSADGAYVVGQRIIGEGAAGDDVGTHGMIASLCRRGCGPDGACSVCPKDPAIPGRACLPAGCRGQQMLIRPTEQERLPGTGTGCSARLPTDPDPPAAAANGAYRARGGRLGTTREPQGGSSRRYGRTRPQRLAVEFTGTCVTGGQPTANSRCVIPSAPTRCGALPPILAWGRAYLQNELPTTPKPPESSHGPSSSRTIATALC